MTRVFNSAREVNRELALGEKNFTRLAVRFSAHGRSSD